MIVPLFDLRVIDSKTREALSEKFHNVLTHGRLFLGPEIEELEEKVAGFCSSKYAVGVSSGSSALYLALKASGIKEGDEVITTPLTWIITINAIVACGAIPVFADITDDFNIDPNSIKQLITKKTRAILPMHYAGHMCDMDKITTIANQYGLLIIEDAAQAFGASLNGKMAGTFSSAGAFSMNPMKSLGGYGEAGVVVTDDWNIFQRLLVLRHAGTIKNNDPSITNYCTEPSLNHKISTINAALLIVSFDEFAGKMAKREKIAISLNKKLNELVETPIVKDNEVHGRYIYPLKVNDRDVLMEYLKERGIETKIFNKPLACNSPAFKKFKTSPVPNSEFLLNRNLVIPSHEKLTNLQLDYIGSTFKEFFDKGSKVGVI